MKETGVQIKKSEKILTSLINTICVGLSIATLLAVITIISSL